MALAFAKESENAFVVNPEIDDKKRLKNAPERMRGRPGGDRL